MSRSALLLVILLLPFATSCQWLMEESFVNDLLDQSQNVIQAELGFSIHLLADPLPAGTVLQPDTPGGVLIRDTSITCQGECLLAMIDLMPGAHFGHPVAFGVYDLGVNTLKGPVVADWWPWVPATGKRFFHTEEERRMTVVRCDQDCSTVYPDPEPEVHVGWSPLYWADSGTVPCSVWAVVINGYDTREGSFGKDTEGMNTVLRGMGVPKRCICYLTDDDEATEGDASARPRNVYRALEYIADRTLSTGNPLPNPITLEEGRRICGEDVLGRAPDRAGPADDFLFFVSSHGSNGESLGRPPEFSCNNFKPGGGWISSEVLSDLISDIDSLRTTVIMEACYSGAFFDDLKDLPNASFFFSAGEYQQSYGDRDPPEFHDDNPGDAGSEAIWGFIEAFGTSAADGIIDPNDRDGRISFSEAVEYAQATDATPKINNKVRSVMETTHPNPSLVPYPAVFDPQTTTLTLEESPISPETTSSEREIERCQSNLFRFDLTNTGAAPLSLGTLRFHVEESGDTGPFDWDHAETIIVAGMDSNAERTVGFNWKAPNRYQAGSIIELVVHIDSPQASVATRPEQIKRIAGIVENPSNNILPCGCTACRNDD